MTAERVPVTSTESLRPEFDQEMATSFETTETLLRPLDTNVREDERR